MVVIYTIGLLFDHGKKSIKKHEKLKKKRKMAKKVLETRFIQEAVEEKVWDYIVKYEEERHQALREIFRLRRLEEEYVEETKEEEGSYFDNIGMEQ